MTPRTAPTPAPPSDGATSPALTLGSFLAALAARLNRLKDAAVAPVKVRAIPLPPAGLKVYSGRVYCGPQDVAGRDTMDATVAEAQTDAVPWNVEALVTGLVSVRVGLYGKLVAEVTRAVRESTDANLIVPSRSGGHEVAVPRKLFAAILGRIGRLRLACASG
jgi:hypothetical protein